MLMVLFWLCACISAFFLFPIWLIPVTFGYRPSNELFCFQILFPLFFPPFLSAVLSVPCPNSSLHSSPLFSPSVSAEQTMALCWWIWARRTAPHCCTLSCWRARSCCTRSDPPCSPEWPRLWWLWVGSNMHSHIVILKCIQIYSNRYNLFAGLDFSKAFPA